ncbi:putative RNA methyltransferase [Thalassiella azotivora]
MLSDVVAHLACPLCAGTLEQDGGSLVCTRRHRFDVARQGYVTLLPGDARTGTADTATMVAARAAVQEKGLHDVVADALARVAAELLGEAGGDGPAFVVDVGAGTGYHLARVLDAAGSRAAGLALDLSKFAARRAARAHPRIGAVVADSWAGLPVRDACADLVLNVFAPRSATEVARVLRPGGACVVVVPAPDHLTELVGPLGLLSVPPDKGRTLHASLVPHLEHVRTVRAHEQRTVDAANVLDLVAMGPSAWHTDPAETERRVAALPSPVRVTTSVELHVLRPAEFGPGGSHDH